MYRNLKTLLLTLGILSSLNEKQMELVRSKFDIDKIEAKLIELGNSYDGLSDEFTTGLVLNMLADEFPEAWIGHRSSDEQQAA